jgi:mevalonate kinase
MLKKKYPAKILLLGEYTILNGSKALATPYADLSGEWSYGPSSRKEFFSSHQNLKNFLLHNCEEYLDVHALKNDIEKGLWFESSIPEGFGLGSSGSLIAALFDRYHLKNDHILEIKKALAGLEDYFHGSSSGLDPLVSLLQKPLLIHSVDKLEVVQEPLSLNGFFLLNTSRPRQTGPLVRIYQEKLKDPKFKEGCAKILSRDVNLAIDAVLKNDQANLFHHLWHISKFQLEYFSEMIPSEMQGIWSKGLESGDYIVKLCGAGGGGFLLGYSNKLSYSEKKNVFFNYELRELT